VKRYVRNTINLSWDKILLTSVIKRPSPRSYISYVCREQSFGTDVRPAVAQYVFNLPSRTNFKIHAWECTSSRAISHIA
jgi:hypothetical protein